MGDRGGFNPFNYDDLHAQNPFNVPPNLNNMNMNSNTNFAPNKDNTPSFPNTSSSNFAQSFQPHSPPLAAPQGRGGFSSEVTSSFLFNNPNPPVNLTNSSLSDSFLAGPTNYTPKTPQGFTPQAFSNVSAQSQTAFQNPVSTTPPQGFMSQGNFTSFPNQQSFSGLQNYPSPLSQFSSPSTLMTNNYQGINPHILREIQNEIQLSKQLQVSIQQAIKTLGFDFLPNGSIIASENPQLMGLSKQLEMLQRQISTSQSGGFNPLGSPLSSSFQERTFETTNQSKSFCTNCGNQVTQSSKFCASCGSQNSTTPTTPTTPPPNLISFTRNIRDYSSPQPSPSTPTLNRAPTTTPPKNSGPEITNPRNSAKNITPIPSNPANKPGSNSNKCPLCELSWNNVEDLQIHFLSSHVEDEGPHPQKAGPSNNRNATSTPIREGTFSITCSESGKEYKVDSLTENTTLRELRALIATKSGVTYDKISKIICGGKIAFVSKPETNLSQTIKTFDIKANSKVLVQIQLA